MSTRTFSGDYSADMWEAINKAKTVAELRQALYFVCCRIQELEHRIDQEYEQQLNLTPAPAKQKGVK